MPYGRTLYFNDKGTERGLTVENVRDFERYINRKYVKDKRPVTVVILPTTRDKLLPQVVAGMGDIAAGNLTVTEARLKSVDFVAPDDYEDGARTDRDWSECAGAEDDRRPVGQDRRRPPVDELPRQHPGTEPAFRRGAEAADRIQQLPVALEDEDMLEMVECRAVSTSWSSTTGRRISGRRCCREYQGAQGSCRARRRQDRLGDPQGQPRPARRDHGLLSRAPGEAGRGRVPARPVHEEDQADPEPVRWRGRKALRADDRAVSRVRRRVRLRSTDDGGAGLPGVAAEPECQEPGGSDRRHAGHAGDGQGTRRGRHPPDRSQHSRRREIHGPADVAIFQGREVRRAEPRAVRLCGLQRGSGPDPADAEDRAGPRARSRRLVQQCRDRHCGEGRHRNDDLCAKHLQVLRELQTAGATRGGPQQGRRAGDAGKP